MSIRLLDGSKTGILNTSLDGFTSAISGTNTPVFDSSDGYLQKTLDKFTVAMSGTVKEEIVPGDAIYTDVTKFPPNTPNNPIIITTVSQLNAYISPLAATWKYPLATSIT